MLIISVPIQVVGEDDPMQCKKNCPDYNACKYALICRTNICKDHCAPILTGRWKIFKLICNYIRIEKKENYYDKKGDTKRKERPQRHPST